MDPIVLKEVATGVSVVDASEWDGSTGVVPDDAALVCYGPHVGTTCPLVGPDHAPSDDLHGVVLDLNLDRSDHSLFLGQYRRILRPDVPLSIVVRRGQASRVEEGARLRVFEKSIDGADPGRRSPQLVR